MTFVSHQATPPIVRLLAHQGWDARDVVKEIEPTQAQVAFERMYEIIVAASTGDNANEVYDERTGQVCRTRLAEAWALQEGREDLIQVHTDDGVIWAIADIAATQFEHDSRV